MARRGLEALEQAIAKDEAQAEKQDPELRKDNAAKRRASRGALPAHLPRVEVTLAPEDTACPCCRAAMTVIGEDISERLDVIPAQFRVIVTKRPKLACRSCPGTVVQAAAPARLIEGGIPTEAMVAHVLVARYADHLPLYRKRCFATLGLQRLRMGFRAPSSMASTRQCAFEASR
jgi:transposase